MAIQGAKLALACGVAAVIWAARVFAQITPTAELEQVVVTAEKRIQPLQDVPVPVTAISAQTLVDTNQLRVQDWYTRIPGLSFSSGVHGEPDRKSVV